MNTKNNIKYILLFVLFISSLLFFYIPFRMDTYVNYGFSYGISIGQIPYKDFNLIIPLFSPFLYSILLFINNSILIFYLEQTILLVLFSYTLFKLLRKKAWIIITAMFCPFIFCFTYILFPGYNFLIVFEFVLLIYLEENHKSNKLIGLLLGLIILTKHNIGLIILILSILYSFLHNKKETFIRLIFSLIPILIFILYLLFTNSFYPFINYCFLNIKEFSTNFQVNTLYLVLLIISIIILIIQYIKNPSKNSSYLYLIGYLSVVYPLLDEYHTSLFLFLSLIVYLYNSKISIPNKTPILSFIIIIIFITVYDLLGLSHYKQLKLYHYHNFPYEFLTIKEKQDYDYIIKNYYNKKVIYIDYPFKTIFFTSTTNSKLNQYYIILIGNQGYLGSNKLRSNLLQEKDTYFVLPNYEMNSKHFTQFDTTLITIIQDNSTLIKELNNYNIYYKGQ